MVAPKSFRERLAWLGRMPTHYRILFGVQLMFTTVAVNWRLADVRRRRKIRDEEESLERDSLWGSILSHKDNRFIEDATSCMTLLCNFGEILRAEDLGWAIDEVHVFKASVGIGLPVLKVEK